MEVILIVLVLVFLLCAMLAHFRNRAAANAEADRMRHVLDLMGGNGWVTSQKFPYFDISEEENNV